MQRKLALSPPVLLKSLHGMMSLALNKRLIKICHYLIGSLLCRMDIGILVHDAWDQCSHPWAFY